MSTRDTSPVHNTLCSSSSSSSGSRNIIQDNVAAGGWGRSFVALAHWTTMMMMVNCWRSWIQNKLPAALCDCGTKNISIAARNPPNTEQCVDYSETYLCTLLPPVQHARARIQIINRGLCNHSLFTTHDYLSVFAAAPGPQNATAAAAAAVAVAARIQHRHSQPPPPVLIN